MDGAATRTRIWWDGREVNFIRWTNGSLVFAWGNTEETAMHIPRGAVTRLIDRGVLEIEGEMPDWLGGKLTLEPPKKADAPRPARLSFAPPPGEHAQPAPQTNRRSIVARLLAKLGGDPARAEARSES